MFFHETKMNVLDVPSDYVIVHCISADYALGAGVAKQIERKFHIKDALRECSLSQYVAEKGYLDLKETYVVGNIYNVVTKKYYFEKPTMNDFSDAIYNLRDAIIGNSVKKIAMPRIGCGLDKLSWNMVSAEIKKIFSDIDVEIMVCYL